jgi:hypothetical protein
MAIENGTQIRVVLPPNLNSRLEHDAAQVGVPVASIVRLIIADYYDLLAKQQPQPQPREITVGGVTYTQADLVAEAA